MKKTIYLIIACTGLGLFLASQTFTSNKTSSLSLELLEAKAGIEDEFPTPPIPITNSVIFPTGDGDGEISFDY